MTHGEYECPGCPQFADFEIVRDAYGCDAGRHCTQVTAEQRIVFERMIAERLSDQVSDRRLAEPRQKPPVPTAGRAPSKEKEGHRNDDH